MDVTERLLNTKVVVFLEFLWFAVEFLLVQCNEIFDFENQDGEGTGTFGKRKIFCDYGC